MNAWIQGTWSKHSSDIACDEGATTRYVHPPCEQSRNIKKATSGRCERFPEVTHAPRDMSTPRSLFSGIVAVGGGKIILLGDVGGHWRTWPDVVSAGVFSLAAPTGGLPGMDGFELSPRWTQGHRPRSTCGLVHEI